MELAPSIGGPLRLYYARRRQGEGDYRTPFPPVPDYPVTPEIFEGIIVGTHRAGVQWSTAGRIAAVVDAGYAWLMNADHEPARRASGFEGRIRISAPLALRYETRIHE